MSRPKPILGTALDGSSDYLPDGCLFLFQEGMGTTSDSLVGPGVATATNGATFTGARLNLDGVDDYASCGTGYAHYQSNGVFTVATRFRCTDSSASPKLVGKWAVSESGGWELYVSSTGGIGLLFGSANAASYVVRVAGSGLADGSDHDVAVSFSDPSASGTIIFVIDGVETSSNYYINGSGPGVAADTDLRIGWLEATTDATLGGRVDYVLIDGTAWSAAKMAAFQADPYLGLFGEEVPPDPGDTGDYTLSGPSSGPTASFSADFTVTLGAGTLGSPVVVAFASTVAGDEFDPPIVTLTDSSRSATTRLIAISAGARTVSATNDGGLVDPAGVDYAAAGRSVAQALATWEATMVAYTTRSIGGRKYLDNFPPAAPLGQLDGDNHYDPIAVYRNVRRYTDDPAWDDVVDAAVHQVRDIYYLGYGVPIAYHCFAEGLADRYLGGADPLDRRALAILATTGHNDANFDPFAAGNATSWIYSREVALAGLANLAAESAIGFGHRRRLDDFKDAALGHLTQWQDPADPCVGVQTFMVGITLHFLIRHHDRYRDAAIPPAIKGMIDWLRAHSWIASNWSWPYWDRNTDVMKYGGNCGNPGLQNTYDGSGQPLAIHCVLNPLIAHAYAWYATYSGDLAYRVEYDEAFIGAASTGGSDGAGAEAHGLAAQKQYNQSYWIEPSALIHRAAFGSPPPAATTYAATPSATQAGEANRPGPPIRIALPVGTSVADPVTITFSGPTGTAFLPPSVTLTTDAPESSVRIAPAPASDGQTIAVAMTNDGGLADPADLSFAVSGVATFATAVKVTGPSAEWGPRSYSPPLALALEPPGSVPPRSADGNGGMVRLNFGDSYAGGGFFPGFVVLSADTPTGATTYNPNVNPNVAINPAARSIGVGADDGTLGLVGSPVAYTAGTDPDVADSTLSGPSTATRGLPTTLTAALGFGIASGTIRLTFAADRPGTFDPAYVDLAESTRSGTTAFTPTESGPYAITTTNDGGLAAPTALDLFASPFRSGLLIDDSDPGFALPPSNLAWSTGTGGLGLGGTFRTSTGQGRDDQDVSWTFDGLQPGSTVRLAATWPPNGYAGSAVYRIDRAGFATDTIYHAQATAPGDGPDDLSIATRFGPAFFRPIGTTWEVPSDGTIVVRLREGYPDFSYADAVHLLQQGGPATYVVDLPPGGWSGPAGSAGPPVRVTLGPGPVAATIRVTPSDDGAGGRFFPPHLDLTVSARSGTFAYIPTTAGTLKVSFSNDGGLTDPAPIHFEVTPQPQPQPQPQPKPKPWRRWIRSTKSPRSASPAFRSPR